MMMVAALGLSDDILVNDLALGSLKVEPLPFSEFDRHSHFIQFIHSDMTIAVWRDVVLSRYLLDWVFRPVRYSDVTGLVGYKFELCNQPIAHLKLRTGSRTGSTGSNQMIFDIL